MVAAAGPDLEAAGRIRDIPAKLDLGQFAKKVVQIQKLA
jgi:hypothetical protein